MIIVLFEKNASQNKDDILEFILISKIKIIIIKLESKIKIVIYVHNHALNFKYWKVFLAIFCDFGLSKAMC